MLIKVAACSKSKENANVYMLKLIYKIATENFQISRSYWLRHLLGVLQV